MTDTSVRYNQKDVRRALENILKSTMFRASPRAQDFLKYVVIETLEGRADQISGTTIGQDVFKKDASFESAYDAIVRVGARRLRSKLRDYYLDEKRYDRVILTMPKGSYKVEITSNENEQTVRHQLIKQSRRNLIAKPSSSYAGI